ncbi:MAG: hypothetical protein GQ527_07170 [Bacteroidales bacterium]|nr:hypothetical protein [Bacteroidales bacterium]
MLKKRIAVFFILLANIVLLAHVAVPHHHHDTKVCVESTHCEKDGDAHQHQTQEHQHQHDGQNTNHYCAFDQIYVLPSKQIKQESSSLLFDANPIFTTSIQAVLANQQLQIFLQIFPSDLFVPLIASSYSFSVKTFLGLRGPPMA